MPDSVEKQPPSPSDAGSFHDNEKDPEKALGSAPTLESGSDANVGLHEFDVAKHRSMHEVFPERKGPPFRLRYEEVWKAHGRMICGEMQVFEQRERCLSLEEPSNERFIIHR